MKPKSSSAKKPAKQVVKDIRRARRRHFLAEDKMRIVLERLRGDNSIAELCRKEGVTQSLYYTWSKEFMEAGKRRLAGDTTPAATTDEVKDLHREASALKEFVADLTLETACSKKHDRGWWRRRIRYPGTEKLEIISAAMCWCWATAPKSPARRWSLLRPARLAARPSTCQPGPR